MATRQETTHETNYETFEARRENWANLLNAFTARNQARTCRLEVLAPEEARLLVDDRPFLAISLDDAKGEPCIIVECGDTAGESPRSLRHIITDPTAVREWRPHGSTDALEIEVRGQGKVVLTINPHPGRETLHLDEVGRSEAPMGISG